MAGSFGLHVRKDRLMKALFSLLGLCLWLPGLLGGCALRPPVDANGLPRVSRYTNSIQLDFLLGQYKQVAQKSASPGSPSAGSLLEKACLGWERTVFDLHGARLYPSLLRQSPETLMLEQVFVDLPLAIQRNPRPAACDGEAALTDGAQTAALATNPVLAQNATQGQPQGQAMQPAQPNLPNPLPTGSAGTPASPASASTVPPLPATASATAPGAENAASIQTGGQPAEAVSGRAEPAMVLGGLGTAARQDPVVQERAALARLRAALSLPTLPPAFQTEQAVATRLDPTLPLPPPASVDLPVLAELAESDLPGVRLRARFHRVGLCTLAVEAADRNQQTQSTDPHKTSPFDPALCGGEPGTSLRLAQRKLLRSLLVTWRVRRSEPFADFVGYLASFVTRDNPVLDGPRTSR